MCRLVSCARYLIHSPILVLPTILYSISAMQSPDPKVFEAKDTQGLVRSWFLDFLWLTAYMQGPQGWETTPTYLYDLATQNQYEVHSNSCKTYSVASKTFSTGKFVENQTHLHGNES